MSASTYFPSAEASVQTGISVLINDFDGGGAEGTGIGGAEGTGISGAGRVGPQQEQKGGGMVLTTTCSTAAAVKNTVPTARQVSTSSSSSSSTSASSGIIAASSLSGSGVRMFPASGALGRAVSAQPTTTTVTAGAGGSIKGQQQRHQQNQQSQQQSSQVIAGSSIPAPHGQYAAASLSSAGSAQRFQASGGSAVSAGVIAGGIEHHHQLRQDIQRGRLQKPSRQNSTIPAPHQHRYAAAAAAASARNIQRRQYPSQQPQKQEVVCTSFNRSHQLDQHPLQQRPHQFPHSRPQPHPRPRQPQPQPQPQQAPQCLVTILTRPNTCTKWGLQISLFESNYLVVGNVEYGTVRRLTSFGKVGDWTGGAAGGVGVGEAGGGQIGAAPTPALLPLAAVQSGGRGHQHQFAGGLTLTTPYLQAGDLILSINSRPILSFGGSLELITTYLRTHISVQIVAVRCWRSMVASASALVGNGRTSERIENSSRGAWGEMRSVLGLPPARTASTPRTMTAAAARSTAVTTTSASVRHQRPASATTTSISTSRKRILSQIDYDPMDGKRSHLYLNPEIQLNFGSWLNKRKATWRKSWSVAKPSQIDDYEPLDGKRSHLYLNPEVQHNFGSWLNKRKVTWRKSWPVAKRLTEFEECADGCGRGEDSSGGSKRKGGAGNDDSDDEEENITVRNDFWTTQGYPTFHHWLASSKGRWSRDYSWHRAKRRKIEHDVDVVVRLPSVEECKGDDGGAAAKFATWLDVRKNQWRILTRKRQRERQQEEEEEKAATMMMSSRSSGSNSRKMSRVDSPSLEDDATLAKEKRTSGSSPRTDSPNSVVHALPPRPYLAKGRSTNTEIALIDSILEEEERKRQALEERDPLDISFIFNSSLGAPDDAVASILSYLPVSEHWKFLCISYTTSMAIRQRDYMWRSLCPSRWTLPRRPRVPWYKMYITKIRMEEETIRKQSDEVLIKAYAIIEKKDHLNKMEKLIKSTKKKFSFDVNYTSGVVCERNSLLNLAVINGRHKIARFLIESEGANVETVDRGNFSPLINAAWRGDRPMVRYLMGRGANRTLVGMYHSSKGICPADFDGHTAEGWARERGFTELAELIRLGL